MRKKSLICKIKDALSPGNRLFVPVVAVFGLTLVSCAQDDLTGELFSSDVTNTTLASPGVNDISITPTTDNARTIISWKVVHGASSYDCKVYDVTNESEPVVLLDSIVDGVSFTVERAEDTNYKFAIRTLANTEVGNADAPEATEVSFTTFVSSFATIPEGDLYAYFQENPIPAETTEEICYDLVPGGNYTVSQALDFGGSKVTLRCTNKFNKPTVTLGENANLQTYAPMTLKNLKIDAAAAVKTPVIALSKTPDEAIKGATGGGDFYNIIGGSIYLTNCDFVNVTDKMFYDNEVRYCVETFMMDNCTVQLATAEANISGQAMFYLKSGFIKDITIKNSTWYNTTEFASKYFIQYNNSGRIDRAGYDKNSQTQSVNMINNTFYNVCSNNDSQWCNYGGFNGQKYTNFEVTGNIWYECTPNGGGIARRICGGRGASSYGKCIFNNNTYWVKGVSETGYESYDTGLVLQTDPAFANPANGDFTPTGAEQLQYKTGDPRWIPLNNN